MKILIIEDEERIANTIKKGLQAEHFTVDTVYDGQTGYDMASGEDYDVIVLDRMLPKVDGIEICKRLRKEGSIVPVLMLTAKSQTEDKVEGLNCGADDYLTKPFSFDELVARIRALARRPHHTTEPVLQVRDLTLNVSTSQVVRNHEIIALSHREFALLEYLLRNKNRVLSKDHIIEHVWEYEADILPNTVEVTMRNLRNKIEKPFPQDQEIIKTIRGFGYIITEHV